MIIPSVFCLRAFQDQGIFTFHDIHIESMLLKTPNSAQNHPMYDDFTLLGLCPKVHSFYLYFDQLLNEVANIILGCYIPPTTQNSKTITMGILITLSVSNLNEKPGRV
jgi:hypothetical protein